MTDEALEGRAGLGRRAAARAIDHLLVSVVNAVLLTRLPVDPVALLFDPTSVAASELYTLVALVTLIEFVYFAAFETGFGRTPAKRLLGLRVTSDGRRPDTVASFKRNSWLLLGLVPLPLLLLVAVIAVAVSIANDPQGRGFHDRWAGARVAHA